MERLATEFHWKQTGPKIHIFSCSMSAYLVDFQVWDVPQLPCFLKLRLQEPDLR